MNFFNLIAGLCMGYETNSARDDINSANEEWSEYIPETDESDTDEP